MLRFIYFSIVFALFYWLISLLIQRLWAIRKVKVSVDAAKKQEAINQLEQAFASEEAQEDK